MITNEIKSKCFANYIGSEAMIDFGEPNAWSGRSFGIYKIMGINSNEDSCLNVNLKPIENNVSMWYGWSDNISILLTKLSSTTDEDAIKCAKLRGFVNFSNVEFIDNGYWIRWNEIKKNKFVSYIDLTLPQIDYLRSKGYALPYMDYSVDDLVENGIYTLKD